MMWLSIPQILPLGTTDTHAWRPGTRAAASECLLRRFKEQPITAKEAGRGNIKNTKLMNTTSKLSPASRKELVSMLSDDYNGTLRRKAREQYRQVESKLREALIEELAQEKGALAIKEELESAKSKTEELEEQLNRIGFRLDGDNDFYLSQGSPLWEILEQRITEQIGTWDDINSRFDQLRVEMMTVDTLADAQKLLQSANAFCVAK